MLSHIDKPTLEQAGACTLIGALLDAVLPSIARTNQAAFTMFLLEAKPDIDPAVGMAMVKEACRLRDDLERLGRLTDQLLAARQTKTEGQR